MGRDLGPNPARYNGSCRPGTKLFSGRAVPGPCFFSCFGPAHQARPKCTPILVSTDPLQVSVQVLARRMIQRGGAMVSHVKVV
jgi:hypothetical protein